MTLAEILNYSKTWLDLSGRTAYIREHGVITKAPKSKADTLLNNRESAVVHLNNNATTAKLMRRILLAGFIVKGMADYGNGEIVVAVQAL